MRGRMLALAACGLVLLTMGQAPKKRGAGRKRRRSPKEIEVMKPKRQVVYKKVGDVELKLDVFEPAGHKPSDKRPAVVFFFGGGWVGGAPGQFYAQCAYLASRGMVAMSAEYRVKSRHGVTPYECVTDGKSAVRWIRANAKELGIDPERIVAGGGSAGAHVAACTGVVPGLDEEAEDANVSSRPNALVLFNPPVILDPESVKDLPQAGSLLEKIRTRMAGRDPVAVSPHNHVKAGAPPTIILHGVEDKVVPFETVRLFAEAMKKAGNRCELMGHEGQGHGFFNYGRGETFTLTMRQVDGFLTSLGCLEGECSVDRFLKSLATEPK